MMSAFGVEHPNVIFKRDDDRAKHYGRMAGITAGIGGTAAAMGTGSEVVRQAEKRSYDPMEFTHRKLAGWPPHHR